VGEREGVGGKGYMEREREKDGDDERDMGGEREREKGRVREGWR